MSFRRRAVRVRTRPSPTITLTTWIIVGIEALFALHDARRWRSAKGRPSVDVTPKVIEAAR